MFALPKKDKAKTSAFSDFMQSASSREKKRIYSKVLTKAIERQNDVIKRIEVERQHC